jgi:hypothetical protein
MSISSAPPKIQSAVIKFAADLLLALTFPRRPFDGLTIAAAIDQTSSMTSITLFENADLNKMLLSTFITCLTSSIQYVWPGSSLSVSTPVLFNCQSVLPITNKQFLDISSAILDANYLTGQFVPLETITAQIQSISEQVTSELNSQLGSVNKFIALDTLNVGAYTLINSPRDFDTKLGSLISSTLRTEIGSDLSNMLVTDYLACIAGGALFPSFFFAIPTD